MKYNIVYADPPWQYKNYNYKETKTGQRAKRGEVKEYDVMNIKDIQNLPIQNICDDNCILFLWVTFPLLIEGIETLKSWGFNYKTIGFVWVKANKRVNNNQLKMDNLTMGIDDFIGMGNWTRSNSEICLIGTKGKVKRISAKVRQIIYTPIEEHSKKPNEARKRIVELMGDLPRVELFARQKADGWDSWGNEVKNDIELI